MKVFHAALTSAFILGTTSLAMAADPQGTWVLSNGDITVKVGSCGGAVCGRLVALKKPLDKEGRPKSDKHNPDPALRKRPLIGVTVLSSMKPKDSTSWVGGTIYNPDDGKTYSASMQLAGDTMKVQACLMGILCQTKNFKRVD